MAKKIDCDEGEIANAIKLAKNSFEMIPDVSKATLAKQRQVFEKTINEVGGCRAKPKGGKGGGAKTKQYFEHYRAVQEKTGKAWKDYNK